MLFVVSGSHRESFVEMINKELFGVRVLMKQGPQMPCFHQFCNRSSILNREHLLVRDIRERSCNVRVTARWVNVVVEHPCKLLISSGPHRHLLRD